MKIASFAYLSLLSTLGRAEVQPQSQIGEVNASKNEISDGKVSMPMTKAAKIRSHLIIALQTPLASNAFSWVFEALPTKHREVRT